MSSNNRDDFTPNDKRIMAERVSWKCSFPGCYRNTVGPNSDDPSKKINNGIAAHIHAAASGGPRYNPEMTPKERKHISNGIWMCRNHGNLIDADYTEYSASTLHDWKSQAEKRASYSLRLPTQETSNKDTTLVQLGNGIIYFAHWNTIHSQEWSFELVAPLIGSADSLNHYVLEFSSLCETVKYVVIESQGDARKILDIKIEVSSEGKYILFINVDKKPAPTNPHDLGMDLRVDDTGDLSILNGALERVQGIDNAWQMLSICMSTIKGEIDDAKELGSLATQYYNEYKSDLEIFSKLILLELIRLSLIPLVRRNKQEKIPSLHFIKRFLSVRITSTELIHSRFKAHIKLEWGNGELWDGEIPIFVLQT
ncbi:MAG: HNH endonuclease [Gammaproteobacteria bacterium]|nr:HNH endonuclease [Gammaproteobacteria bacterium]